MQRKNIKVGETYGVVRRRSRYVRPVKATVVALDEPYTYPSRSGSEFTVPNGGIRVRFDEPMVVHYDGFRPASEARAESRTIDEYVFGDREDGQVGSCFVGPWAEIEAQREIDERQKRERAERVSKAADEFAPVLAAYRERLAAVGLPVDVYDDGSGLGGARISMGLNRVPGGRPTGFDSNIVRVDREVFDRLVEIAAEAGATV